MLKEDFSKLVEGQVIYQDDEKKVINFLDTTGENLSVLFEGSMTPTDWETICGSCITKEDYIASCKRWGLHFLLIGVFPEVASSSTENKDKFRHSFDVIATEKRAENILEFMIKRYTHLFEGVGKVEESHYWKIEEKENG